MGTAKTDLFSLIAIINEKKNLNVKDAGKKRIF